MKALFLMILALVLAIPVSAQEMAAGGGGVMAVHGYLLEADDQPVKMSYLSLREVTSSGYETEIGFIQPCSQQGPAMESDECINDLTSEFFVRVSADNPLVGKYRLVAIPANQNEYFPAVYDVQLFGWGRDVIVRINRTRRIELLVGPIPQGAGVVSVSGQISSALQAERNKIVRVEVVHSIMTSLGEDYVKTIFSHSAVPWAAGTQLSNPYFFGTFTVGIRDRVGTQYCVTVTVSDPEDRFTIYSKEKVCQTRRAIGYDVPQ